jgi:hypothetical protein
MMDDTLADALPREIKRVSAKRDRWIAMAKEDPVLGMGMVLGSALMQVEIEGAVRACASGDVVEMLAVLQDLKEYDDDD